MDVMKVIGPGNGDCESTAGKIRYGGYQRGGSGECATRNVHGSEGAGEVTQIGAG